jgi:hypothetical protein
MLGIKIIKGVAMPYKKISIIAFSLLFLSIVLPSLSGICQADSQTAQNPAIENTETKATCVLGSKVNGFPFYVYKDFDSGENNFFPTGMMGDFSDYGVNSSYKESPYAGSSCIKIVYMHKPKQTYGWSGLYWQYPPNNWGNIPKAYDLTGATKLTFWARGQYGGEVINKFQIGGITGKYRDSGIASIGAITLSKKWTKYTINLRNMDNSIIVSNEDKDCWPFMEPLSRIIGGFCWATSLTGNNNYNKGITFYLDEIRFEND